MQKAKATPAFVRWPHRLAAAGENPFFIYDLCLLIFCAICTFRPFVSEIVSPRRTDRERARGSEEDSFLRPGKVICARLVLQQKRFARKCGYVRCESLLLEGADAEFPCPAACLHSLRTSALFFWFRSKLSKGISTLASSVFRAFLENLIEHIKVFKFYLKVEFSTFHLAKS